MSKITIDKEVLDQALEALESIALAGMSGSGQESEEGMRDWHARQAWKFIGIAARALDSLREALAQPQPVQEEPVAIDNIVSGAMHRYLRVCSSGGMSSKHIKIVQANVDEAERLDYFKLAIAGAIAAQPLTPEWYARWIRNNYQDHPNIAKLCEELTKAAHGSTKGQS